jgi:hypothetical protein
MRGKICLVKKDYLEIATDPQKLVHKLTKSVRIAIELTAYSRIRVHENGRNSEQ